MLSSCLFLARAILTNYLILTNSVSIPHMSLFWSVLFDHLFDGFIMFLSKKQKTIKTIDGNLLIFKIILLVHVILNSIESCQIFIYGCMLSCTGSFIFLLEKEFGIEQQSYHMKKCCKDNIKYDTECSICLDFLEVDLVQLPCNHVFHENCINRYIKVSCNVVCPTCRCKF